MYRVNYHYSNRDLGRDTFNTHEEAVAFAKDSASTDMDGGTYEVCILDSVHRADPVKHPVKSAVISDENFSALIEQSKENV